MHMDKQRATRQMRQEEQAQYLASPEKEVQPEYDRAHGIALPAGEGLHAGALSGLTWEERERAIEEEIARTFSKGKAGKGSTPYADALWDQATSSAIPMQPVGSIREMLATGGGEIEAHLKDSFLEQLHDSNDEMLAQIADVLSEKPASFFAEMAETSAESYPLDDLVADLDVLPIEGYNLLKELVNSDYRKDITRGQVDSETAYGVHDAIPFARTFLHDDRLTAVLLEEYQELFETLDWDEQDKRRSKAEHALDTASSMAFFCGIAGFADVYRQFCAWYPDEDLWGSEAAFTQMLRAATTNRDIVETGFVCSEGGGEHPPQVVSLELLADCGGFDDAADDDVVAEKISELAEFLLQRREVVGFNGLPDGLRGKDPLDYLFELPQVRRLVSFLDERVPDGENDYTYADRAAEAIVLSLVPQLGRPQDILAGVIDDGIVTLGSSEEMEELSDCFTNVANSVPCWYNYGVAPGSLHDVMKGGKSFYDELGRKIKVGRNDPCPCGSGKKYKKCCGR